MYTNTPQDVGQIAFETCLDLLGAQLCDKRSKQKKRSSCALLCDELALELRLSSQIHPSAALSRLNPK